MPPKRFKPNSFGQKSSMNQHQTNEQENDHSSRLSNSSLPLGMEHMVQLQRTIGNRATSRIMSNIVQRQPMGTQVIQLERDLDEDAKLEWDCVVESLVNHMLNEYGENVEYYEIDYYLEAECGIENPRSPYFELDDEDEYEDYVSELRAVEVDSVYSYFFELEMEAEQEELHMQVNAEDAEMIELVEASSDEEEELDPLADIYQLLDTVSVDVQLSRGQEVQVNLGEYFRKPKKYYIPKLALRQEIEALLIMEETNPSPDPDRLTAFNWVLQELYIAPLKKSGGGGGGNLKVNMNSPNELKVSGRPGFEKNANDLPGMKKGYHRRHIVAWHTLAHAVENLINKLLTLQVKDEGIANAIVVLQQLAAKLLAKEQQDVTMSDDPPKKTNGRKRKEKAPLPTGKTTDPKDLCTLVEHILSKLNSNVLNLWPGDGYQNSLINTYQSMFRLWAKQCITLGKDQIANWKQEKLDDLENRMEEKKGKYKTTVKQFYKLLNAWAPDEESSLSNSEQLCKFLLLCADTFEVDFPYQDDRKGFEEGQHVSNHILGLAGTLLKWSENEEDAFKGKNLSELIISFETVLNEFMFPPEASYVGKPEHTKKGAASSKQSKESDKKKSDVLVEEVKWDRQQQMGVGIPNIGNSCYIASVMQMILTIPQYRNLFMNNPHEELYNNEIFEVIDSGRNLLLAMPNLAATSEQITAFRTALISSGWLGGEIADEATQQDAGELMIYILDLLGNNERVNRLHAWQDRGSGVGPATEHANDSIINLSGIRFAGNSQSIEDLLEQNLSPTRVESEMLNNNTVRDHMWRLEGTLPNVLTFQLNRFSFSTILGRVFKLKEKVTTGATLAIPNTMTPDGSTVQYNIQSFIVHLGQSTSNGHYVSYVRRSDGWYLCDDSRIYKVSDAEVSEKVKDAYIISYLKQ